MRRFEQACRSHGLKLTHQRAEIFRTLARSEEHPNAEIVYRRVHRRVPAVSLDTVYRTLGTLEERGVLHRAEVSFGPARYDANTEHHHHFLCTKCGLVRDVYSQKMNRLPLPDSVKALGTVTSWQLHLRGLCTRCAPRRGTSGKRG